MRSRRHLLTALVIVCYTLGACSSDKPAATAVSPNISQAPADSSGGAATLPAGFPGDIDCAALKTNVGDLVVNWQVVIGFGFTPTSEWAQNPLGSIDKFGDQLSAVTAALGSNADAAASLSFMSGANDIVVRGRGGDSTAQADLAAYMGPDVEVNVAKQLPISLAYSSAGCK
jgi:hypothetical protein